MALAHESPKVRLRDRNEAESPSVLSDEGLLAEPPVAWRQSRFFALFLGFSLAFHVCLVGLLIIFDWVLLPQLPGIVEIPVELVNENQASKAQQKGGNQSAGIETGAQSAAPQKQSVEGSGNPGKGSQDQAQQSAARDKPAGEPLQPPEQPAKPEDKKIAQDKAVEDKAAEEKAAQDKADEEKAAQAKAAQEASQQRAAQDKALQDKAAQDQAKENKPSASKPAARAAASSQRIQSMAQKSEAAQKQQQTPAPVQQAGPKPPSQPDPQQQVQTRMSQQMQQDLARALDPYAAQEPRPETQRQAPISTFIQQPSDHLSLAIPAPLPTNDADAEQVSYKIVVFGQLERVKEYPETARARHATGHVILAFSVDDAGQAQNVSLIQTSGQDDLDTEALSMVTRAAPFPVPPPGAQRDFAVDIGFGGL